MKANSLPESQSADRRIKRTRVAIRNAFVCLIEEKGFENITVSDITARAAIHRGTFYLHYRDKYDLLERTIEDVVHDIETIVIGAKPVNPADYIDTDQPLPTILKLFHYIKAHDQIFRALLGLSGSTNLMTKIRKVMERNLILVLSGGQAEENFLAPKEYLVAYIMHAHLGIIQSWIETGCKESPQEMAAILTRLSMNGPFRAISFVSQKS